jgi:hypothetical protein
MEAKAGRLTKPPPGGSCGLALSKCESGRLRKAPTRNQGPSGRRNRTDRTPDFGSGLVRRKAGLRLTRRHRKGRDFGSLSVGQDRVSARELRSGGTQDFGPWTARQNQGFGRGSCRKRCQRLRPEETPGQEDELRFRICRAANRQGFGPVGEPAGKPLMALRRRHGTPEESGAGLRFG